MNRKIDIRDLRIDDISFVYRLGHRLFQSHEISTLYRTWDAYEVTMNFNRDPRLSLVAATSTGRIVGFALGTTYENAAGGWTYGHILWMGVSPKWQRSRVGTQLYHEMERRMHRNGVRMVFVDTARSNTGAIRFFKRMGYGKPEAEVWMSKVIQKMRKIREANKIASPGRRKRHNRMCGTVSRPFLRKNYKRVDPRWHSWLRSGSSATSVSEKPKVRNRPYPTAAVFGTPCCKIATTSSSVSCEKSSKYCPTA